MTNDVNKDVKLKDFEWGTVGRYMQYVSLAAGLVELNLHSINSFEIKSGKVGSLLAAKRGILYRIEENARRLATWTGARSERLTQNEKVVLRTMYRDFCQASETVKRHIELAKDIENKGMTQSSFFTHKERNDEIPF